jgi:Ca-activated chloride channel family protein
MAASLIASAREAMASAAVTLDVGADTPVAETGRAQRVIVRALIKPDGAADRKRVPLAVALVIDVSGSMQSDGKMENAKRGAQKALDMLTANDIASVIAYSDEAHVVLQPRRVSDKSEFKRAISRLEAGGSTALYDGVREGAKVITSFVGEGYVPRLILLSDGMANVGPSSTRELASLGRTLALQEMTITTIGLGLDYNEDLMTALASESGGNSYFAKSSKALPEIFERDMEDATSISARHVRVTFSCARDIKPIRSVGRDGELHGDAIGTSVNNLYGDEKYALFEIELPSVADESTICAGVVKIEYTDASTGLPVLFESALDVRFTKNSNEIAKNRNIEIAAQTEIARNAEIREEAVRLSDAGQTERASTLLKSRTKILMDSAASLGSAAPMIKEEAHDLAELADDIEENGEMSGELRKESMNKAYIQKNQQSDATGASDEKK